MTLLLIMNIAEQISEGQNKIYFVRNDNVDGESGRREGVGRAEKGGMRSPR